MKWSDSFIAKTSSNHLKRRHRIETPARNKRFKYDDDQADSLCVNVDSDDNEFYNGKYDQ